MKNRNKSKFTCSKCFYYYGARNFVLLCLMENHVASHTEIPCLLKIIIKLYSERKGIFSSIRMRYQLFFLCLLLIT